MIPDRSIIGVTTKGHIPMPYGPFGSASIPGFSLTLPMIQPTNKGAMVYLCMQGPGMPVVESWASLYQLAFEQARIALQPSPFQQMLKPSWN
jgi:hypothetical protein